MKFLKILSTFIFLIHFIESNSQNTENMITSNIQEKLINKTWTFTKESPKRKVTISFLYKENGFAYVFINGKELGFEEYYIMNESCKNISEPFDKELIGTSSNGNYIRTQRNCYVIEFYPGFEKIRLKKSYENDSKWQDYNLSENIETN